jgi:hypothetical protein
MACNSVLQLGCHHRVRLAGCDTSHGTFLAQSTTVHCIINWGKHGSFDNGMDGRTHLRQRRAASFYRGCDEYSPMSVFSENSL